MDTVGLHITELIEKFGTEDACHAYLEELRWPEGINCPRCSSKRISRIAARRQFDCDGCRYQFSVRVGTVLHDSHLPLWKWFLVVYLMCCSKKGISANQVKRMTGTTYKTAWYLCHRIRAAMRNEAPEQLRGIIEVDESWVGGKRRGVGKGKYVDKTMVMAAVARGGEVRFEAMPNKARTHKTVKGFIDKHVHDEATHIYTDEFPGYKHLQDANTIHRTVSHAQEWVNGDVHTNTVEGVWSLMKRSIIGSYHKLSVKHLPAYLDEMAFRYNNRENNFLFRDTLLRLIAADSLPYRALVGEKPTSYA